MYEEICTIEKEIIKLLGDLETIEFEARNAISR